MDNTIIVTMAYLAGFVLGLVLNKKVKYYIWVILTFTTLSCIVFFLSRGFFILFISYEIVTLLVSVVILIGGVQVEKVGALYYIILYVIFCTIPFLCCLFYLHR